VKAKSDNGLSADPNQRSAERVKIRYGLDEARSVFNRGGDLPAYLEKALIRYQAAFWARVDTQLVLPKLVKRAHEGTTCDKHQEPNPKCKKCRMPLPLSKKTRTGKGAYEAAGEKLGVSMITAERAYNDYPPSPDDTAMPANRAPVSTPKKMRKSSKR
jgi:hypothetical protein